MVGPQIISEQTVIEWLLDEDVKHMTATTPKADLLVVDDQLENIQLLEMYLKRLGYRVRATTSGMEAIEIARDEPPELILLDISMPEMDGYETCRHLKADQRTQHIPVIFISALEDENDKVQAFKAGGVDYITKPFQFEESSARIETHLNIRRLQAALEASNRELASRLEELDRARTAEQEQRKLAEALRDTITAINSTLDFNEVLDLILAHLERVVPHQAANIALIDESGDLHFVRARGYQERGSEENLTELHLPGNKLPVWQRISAASRTLLIPNTQDDSDWTIIAGFEWVRSYVGAPIIVEGKTIGLLNLDSDKIDFFTPEHGERLRGFADQAAAAIEKARLFNEIQRLAITDGLTGIFNRGHLLKLAESEYERARRYKRPLSAIMVDADNFKRVNDQYGHPTGDVVLQNLAQLLRQNLRTNDVLGRYGGEEFLILMPETGYQSALEVARRIRHQTETTPMSNADQPVTITVSLGVAACRTDETLDDLIRHADEALYAAKAAGRNCVRGYRNQDNL
jgi:diguanylate cyclase (GGDEF)-like protein